jgi:hypothetical protein
MLRRMVFVVMVAALVAGLAVPAQAAGVRATLVLTSGERVTGQLIDMGGADYTMTVSGDEVRLPLGDVAVIDFVSGGQNLPAAEIAKIQTGRNLVVGRDGDTVYARLLDIGGTSPLRLTFKTPEGNSDLSSNDVARIYLRSFQGMSRK